MNVFWIVLGRSALGFVTLLFVTRLIGNKQLGQLNIFTYISGIAIGTMAGAMVVYHDIEILESFIGILVWGIFTVLSECGSIKSRLFHRVITGSPIVVISKGRIMSEALKKERLHLEDLMMLLRTNDVFSITEIEYAILEVNGELSVFRKTDKDFPVREDLELSVKRDFPIQVISDGTILRENMDIVSKTEEWLWQQLEKNNISRLKQVLYAEVINQDELWIQVKK